MDYQLHYNLLIKKAQERGKIKDGYFERHHVVPKSLGGNDKKENRVFLTAREHFIAHMFLARIHGKGMWQAVKMMKQSPAWVGRYVNGRLYESARKEWANFLRGKPRTPEIRATLLSANLGKKWTIEQRIARSESQKGRVRPGDPTSFKHTDATREKLRETSISAKSYLHLPVLSGDKNHMKKPEHRLRQSIIKTAYWKAKRDAKTGMEG